MEASGLVCSVKTQLRGGAGWMDCVAPLAVSGEGWLRIARFGFGLSLGLGLGLCVGACLLGFSVLGLGWDGCDGMGWDGLVWLSLGRGGRHHATE